MCIYRIWIRNIFKEYICFFYVVIAFFVVNQIYSSEFSCYVSCVLPHAAGYELALFSLQKLTAAHLVQQHYPTCHVYLSRCFY